MHDALRLRDVLVEGWFGGWGDGDDCGGSSGGGTIFSNFNMGIRGGVGDRVVIGGTCAFCIGGNVVGECEEINSPA